jgi:serine/threonine protein kinase/tetratricopeptide (TPR) repeat protein
MNPHDWDRCKRIFGDALALTPEERILLLERDCAENPELRAQVVRMLDAATDDASLLDIGAAEQLIGPLGQPLMAGDVVGRYRILRDIGRGGTSLVYLAEHVGLHNRRFAMKVIASGFIAGRHEKFDRECEILATLEHPNIARIIDKGVTESGWPYLVMDYIDGIPIHKYCSAKKLAAPEIVRLMLDCCRAVEYIHSNRVVHCDLKPSNILVDASGSPRILDFGIARLIEPGLKARSGSTTRGVRPLTPNYASPEQLDGSPLTVSTDIYSFGVVLYESLTGTVPFDHSDYAWPQISKRIAEQEPTPPSKACLNTGSTREDLIFARQLRGDLDSVVFKTLAHDPERRYATMDELGDDLERYLSGAVVKARRSNWTERASKGLKRHRRQMVELLVACILIMLAVGLSSWYAVHQQRIREAEYVGELRAIIKPLILPHSEDPPASAQALAALAEHTSIAIDSVSRWVSLYSDLVPDLGHALLRNADSLGDPYDLNLGRTDEARVNYHRALDLMRLRTDEVCAEIRARACLGLGDTYSHPAVNREPSEAADWYERALNELDPRKAELRNTAALAHSRIGALYELLGDAEDARAHYREARSLFPADAESKRPLDSAKDLIQRGVVELPGLREARYAEALQLLGPLLETVPRNVSAWHAAIEAHLSMGASELQPDRLLAAERQFERAADLAEQLVTSDSDDLQARKELSVALRRSALIMAMEGKTAGSNALRDQATKALTSTMSTLAAPTPTERVDPSSPESIERSVDGAPAAPLRTGDLVIANRRTGGIRGTVLVYSPTSLEMSILSVGGDASDIADLAFASRTEFYAVDLSLARGGAIVRLRHHQGRWLQKSVTRGGLLRRPTALAYHDGHLLLVDADARAVRLIDIDPDTGRQTLLGTISTFAEPGKIVYSAGTDYYLSLFWPGEGGPAEIIRFNAKARKFVSVARYGLLEDPVALAITPRGHLIAGDREWAGNSGLGDILRIGFRGSGPDGAQRIVCQKPELSRVTALAVASDREAWYTTAAVPYSSSPSSHPRLFSLDLISGNTAEVTISEQILTAPSALVRVD